MTLARKVSLLLAVAALPLWAGCSSSSTTTPPAAKYTYYSVHSFTVGSPQVGVLPNPLLSTSTLIATVNNTATNGLLDSRAMVFDSAGRMFIISSGTTPPTIQVFTTLPLTASSNPAFTLTLPASYTGSSYGLAFDSSGNLWVSDASPDLVDEFNGPFTTTATLAASIALTPTGCARPEGLAFNPSSGDLYVACEGQGTGTNAVAKFSKGAGFTNGQTPAFFLNGPANPVGAIFDSAGNLYVDNEFASPNGGISQYLSANLTTGATPNVTNGTGQGAAPSIYQFAFDSAGNLYASSCGTTPGVYVFPTGSQAWSATLAPTTTYTDANTAGHCIEGVGVH